MTNKEFIERFKGKLDIETSQLELTDNKTNESLTFSLSRGDIEDLKCIHTMDDNPYSKHIKEKIINSFDEKFKLKVLHETEEECRDIIDGEIIKALKGEKNDLIT